SVSNNGNIGFAGPATLTVNGGSVTVNFMHLGTAAGHGTLNVNGGSFFSYGFSSGADGASAINITGGLMSGNISVGSTFNLGGGTFNGALNLQQSSSVGVQTGGVAAV